MHEMIFATAREQCAAFLNKRISAQELLHAHLQQIARVNPIVNAIVTLDEEGALAHAAHIDALYARGVDCGVLAALPVVHKDLTPAKGLRFTQGSPIFKDQIAQEDSLIVGRLKAAGAVTIGKSNVPEFGAGSQTFNPIFGATRNPYNPTLTSGGSSGGAAAALSTCMVPIADGSDMGGSLRNPAAFCGVVGFRTSPGVVPSRDSWSPLSVDGAMARNVADMALMLAAIAGHDDRATVSATVDTNALTELQPVSLKGKRIAWAPTWGGLPVEHAVTKVIEAQRQRFVDLGAIVEDACPDFSGADEAFQVLRALGFETSLGPLLDTHRNLLKDTVIWNIEAGRALSGSRIAHAQRLQAQIFQRMQQFMQRYDIVVGPVTQVLPFDVQRPYVTHINGVELPTYIDWMKSCFYITVTTHPALAIPCGMSHDGLPVGLQMVGRFRDDVNLLRYAMAYESTLDATQFRPNVAQ
ncbi:MAG: amidase [Chloroflexi bacterium]|nr:amidase [Chloroflexota bacterium]